MTDAPDATPLPSDTTSAPSPPKPGFWTRYRLLVGVSLLIVLVDQALKAWVRRSLSLGQVWAPWPYPWRKWIRIIHWRNTGAAFGLYQGANDWLLWVAVGIVVLVVWHFRHTALEARCLRWGLALQVGGALGNLWDRIVHGSVTDFIAVGRFPVFNFADAAITIGVICLLGSALLEEDGAGQKPSSATSTSAAAEPGSPSPPTERP